MEKNIENEELLKDNIFSVYSNSLNELNRQPVFFGQLSSLIYNWCRDYLNFDVNNMGVEILVIAKRLLNEKSKAKIPQDRNGFIKYLITSLKRGKYEYIRQYEKKNKDDLIRMKESHLGRKLTEDEKISFINKWYDYENAMKINGSSLTKTQNDENPQADYLNSENTRIILDAIKTVLEKKPITRDCKRALFTLYCIDKKYTEGLFSVLDKEIIDLCQNNQKPTKYEVSRKYHPETTVGSAGVMATGNLKEFLSDLESYLKANNPEIFP